MRTENLGYLVMSSIPGIFNITCSIVYLRESKCQFFNTGAFFVKDTAIRKE